jgi:hypothetical protein
MTDHIIIMGILLVHGVLLLVGLRILQLVTREVNEIGAMTTAITQATLAAVNEEKRDS